MGPTANNPEITTEYDSNDCQYFAYKLEIKWLSTGNNCYQNIPSILRKGPHNKRLRNKTSVKKCYQKAGADWRFGCR